MYPYQDTLRNNYKNEHIQKGPPQDSPYPTPTKKYWKAAQDPIPEDATKELWQDKKNKSNRFLKAYCNMPGLLTSHSL